MNVRSRLRRETSISHKEVESAFDLFDLTTRSGMAHTLTAHRNALGRLLPSLASLPLFSDEIQRLQNLAEQSRAALGILGGDAPGGIAPSIHPLAAAYVILGSRLGAEVLRRRLEALPKDWDADVIAYFGDRMSQDHWKALLQMLGDVDCEQEANEIIEGAQAAFGVFREEAMMAAQHVGVAEAL
jgi:heme oxygenase